MKTSNHKQYLPNLDALRFIAFFGVFMAHAYHPTWNGVNVNSHAETIRSWMQVGVLGVNFFFVLSGFLISRLLLIEKQATGGLDIIKYYIRRILRIWPLYFIIILLVLVYYHFINVNFNTHWLWIVFFAANFHIIRFGFPYAPALANLWTISVEEQFYLTFPWIVKLVSRKALPFIYCAIIVASIVFRAVYVHNENYIYFHSFSIMGDFAIGALCAIISLDAKWLERVQNLSRNRIIIAHIIIDATLIFYPFIFNNPFMTIIERALLGVMFGFIILEQVFARNSFLKVGAIPGFTYSGKISYGLYMYHALALQAAGLLLLKYNTMNNFISYMFLFPLIGFFICCSISVISYEMVEQKILMLKNRFS